MKVKYKATLQRCEYIFEVDENTIECDEDIQYAFVDWFADQNMLEENEFHEHIVFEKVKKKVVK